MGDITGALRRRWPLAILGVLLAVAAAVGGAATTSPTYSFTSSVLLLPPEPTTQAGAGGTDFTRGNPLFFLGNLSTTRDLLDSRLMQKNSQRDFAARFPGVEYAAAPDLLGSTPTVVLTTTSGSESSAREAVDYLTDQVPVQLAALQADLQIEDEALITAKTQFTDTEPTVSDKARIRTAILGGGVVGLVALLFIGLLDGLLLGRRRSAARTGAAGATADAADAAEPEPAPAPTPAPPVRKSALSELSEEERQARRERRKRQLAEMSQEEREARREQRRQRLAAEALQAGEAGEAGEPDAPREPSPPADAARGPVNRRPRPHPVAHDGGARRTPTHSPARSDNGAGVRPRRPGPGGGDPQADDTARAASPESHG